MACDAFPRKVTPAPMREPASISVAVTCDAAPIRPTSALRPRTSPAFTGDTRALDPRPRLPPPRRCSRPRKTACGSLDRAHALRFLQRNSTRGHTLERPVPAVTPRPLGRAWCAVSVRLAIVHRWLSLPRGWLLAKPDDLPPSKKAPSEDGVRTLRAAILPPNQPLPRCKHADETRPDGPLPSETLLAGNASPRPPFAAAAVGR